jgi:propanol-preferring alcohol dehydrogenase
MEFTMQTMKVAIARQFKAPLSIEEAPIPVPGWGEVLVKVVASGVCHTDLHAIDGDWPVKPALPLIPGHEGVGHVVAIGPGVEGLKEGDAVGVPWLHHACRACEYCESGWETLCEKQANTGYSVNGGYAEYVIASAPFVGHLPAQTDFVSMAPILCAGVTVYKGLKETEARAGEWVVISGMGGLGHVAVQYAKAMGLQVIGIDIGAPKLELARSLGADIALDATDPDLVQTVQRETGGGAHGVLVTAVSPAAFGQAISCARRRATVSLVGLPPGDFPAPIFDVVLKRITIRGSIVGTRRDLSEAIAFAAQGKVKAQVASRPLDEVNDVLDDVRAGRIEGRVALTM